MADWYYERKGHREGPISEETLVQLIAQKVVTRSTLVWTQGFSDWTTAFETRLRTRFQSSGRSRRNGPLSKLPLLAVIALTAIAGLTVIGILVARSSGENPPMAAAGVSLFAFISGISEIWRRVSRA